MEDLFVGEDLLQRAVEEALSLPVEETAVVFPGRRAASHFALAFARRRGGPCRPPALLTVAGLARKTAGLPSEGPEPLESLRLLLRAAKAAGQAPLPGFCGDLVSFYGPGRAWLEALEALEEEDVPDAALASLRNHPLFDALAPSSRAFHDLLPTLRAAFRELCAREGAWTDAQAVRRAAEHLEGEGRPPWRHLLFVGFFSLTGGQIRLLRALSSSAEVTLLRHHDGRRWEAFRRMEAALAPRHPAPPFAPPDLSFTVEEAPSAHGEALRVGEILSREGLVPEETVVVLPDPDTLLPLLWEGLGVLEEEFNVTLGYPLTRSPLFTLLDAVLRAAEEGDGEAERVSRQTYLRLLFHPYVKNFAPEGLAPGSLRIFFHAVQEFLFEEGRRKVDLRALEAEEGPRRRARTLNPEGPGEAVLAASLVRVHDLFFREVRAAGNLEGLAVLLERLLGVVAEGSPAPYHPFYRPSFQAAARCLEALAEAGRGEEGSAPEPRGLYAFVRERLSEVRVPFTGLPVRGLEVMGVLETQALRFPSVILLDADDEALPTVPSPDPLLPPAFRQALGLPGVLERAEIYRYHVFRLLESSGRAWVLYAARPGRGPSPFVEQLLWEARRAGGEGKVTRLAFRTGGKTEPVSAVPKGPELVARLRSLALSPTSLDRYLRCPLLFYWETVLSLREAEEEEEETDRRQVGKILHEVLAELFRPFAGRPLTEQDFGEMKARLPSLVGEAFGERDAAFLLASLAEERLGKVIDREKARWEPQAYVAAVEEKLGLDLAENGGPPVRVEGRLDRLDALPGGRLRLTDYKLGNGLNKKLPSKDLPDVRADRRTLWKDLRSLQLPLYAEMVRRSRGVPAEALEARLVSLRDPNEEAKLNAVPGGLATFLDDCALPVVRRLAAEILDPDLPFEADPSDPQECKRCPCAPLCRRPRLDPGVY